MALLFQKRNISKFIKSFRCYCSQGPVEFSKNRYRVTRGNFSKIDQGHVSFFNNLLGSERVITEASEVHPYNVDWMKTFRGDSQVVLKPKTTEEMSKILSFCNDNNLAVCPQGGNTGLVGGSVPVLDEIVISTALMNKIINFDNLSGILVCEAGCILETLDAHVKEQNFIMPLDLGAKGSCHIGGNVSTNAGGLRLLRYGNLHGSVMGVEAVKADGEIIDCLKTLKKDNTGYHLKHLFIGSEGTLGIVTKVAIHCPPISESINVAFLGVQDYEAVLRIYHKAKLHLGEIISAFEMMDASSLGCSLKHFKNQNPIGEFPFYVLIETSGSNEIHDSEKLSKFFEETVDTGLVLDGTLCSEPGKIKNLWAMRENVPPGISREGGFTLKYDISIPLKEYYDIIPIMRERLKDCPASVFGYGHIGDGNLHLNIVLKEYSSEIIAKIVPFVFEYVSSVNGSISAEHGIGFAKPQYLGFSKSESAIKLMKDMKKLMDPKGILNPYKVLPY